MRMHRLSFLRCCATASFLMCARGANADADAVTEGASGRAAVTVTVTLNPASTHAISPYIYGTNFGYDIEGVPSALTFRRSGGNRWTAYNWETNASNAGSDYLYQNDSSLSSSTEPGAAVSALIAVDQKNHVATMLTVPLQGWVAGDSNGPVSVANPPDKSRFKIVVYEKKTASKDPFTVKPSLADDNVYMDEFIWALDRKFAGQNIFGARPATQPVFVSLDNEPEAWKSTHLEIQGKTGITPEAYIAKTISLATALKKQFPDLVIFGPANYGFLGIYNWNGEMNGATPSGRDWFADKYLTALKAASTVFGRPLIDVYDFHWYPEATDAAGKRVTDLKGPALSDEQVQAVVQSPRSLWDRTFREKSWIMNTVGDPIAILDRLQTRIDAENPGMKLAITEYNNGGSQHIAGTIAQADNLGVFGAHSVFAAAFWLMTPKEPYTLAGFRAFRNFDGAGHHFGDTSIQATSSSVANVAVYVSTDSGRAGRVVMVAINRSAVEQVTAVTGQPLTGEAHLFQMTAATSAKQSTVQPVAAGVAPVSGSSVTLTLPALSVTTVDIY